MATQVTEHHVSSEDQLQDVLKLALNKNCVVVGVHKVRPPPSPNEDLES